MSRPVKLACRHVWKVYGPHPGRLLGGPQAPGPDALKASGHVGAVRDVSVEVGEGEIFVIMGLSGSGKSTLVRCLARLLDITAGTVEVEGRDIGTLSEAQLIELRRKKMGMVFQSFGLLPHRTALENVAFPLEMRGQDRASRIARAREMLGLVGLKGREGYFPRELSGGQQQRVGIARSLAVEPDIWFLDEPFSALDPLIRREMQDEFMRLQSVLKKTIVFITHDFDEAIRLADKIAIMKDGAVVQQGTPEDIVLNPATDYVAEFTGAVPRAKVVRVASVMRAAGGAVPALSIAASAKVAEAAPLFLTETVLRVVDAQNETLGHLQREDVVALMLGG